MPLEFDPDKYCPEDLEHQQLWHHCPEFQCVRVELCEADRALYRAMNSEIVLPSWEYAPIGERYIRALQAYNAYLTKKGRHHLLVEEYSELGN